jgi:hypothetical protein
MAAYCIYPTPYEFVATTAPAAWGTQSRLTPLSTLTMLYSVAPAPSDRAIEPEESRGPLIRLVRLVRTFSNEKSHHCGTRPPGCHASSGHPPAPSQASDFPAEHLGRKTKRVINPISTKPGGGNLRKFEHLDETKDLFPAQRPSNPGYPSLELQQKLSFPIWCPSLWSAIPNAESIGAETQQEGT